MLDDAASNIRQALPPSAPASPVGVTAPVPVPPPAPAPPPASPPGLEPACAAAAAAAAALDTHSPAVENPPTALMVSSDALRSPAEHGHHQRSLW